MVCPVFGIAGTKFTLPAGPGGNLPTTHAGRC